MYAFPAASNASPAPSGEICAFEPGIALENTTFPSGSTRCRIQVHSGPRPYTAASPLAATARARNGGKSGCGRVTSSHVTPSGASRASPAPAATTTSAPVGSTAMAPGTIGTFRTKSIPPDAFTRTTSPPPPALRQVTKARPVESTARETTAPLAWVPLSTVCHATPDPSAFNFSTTTREENWAFGSPATYTPPVGSTAIAPANPRWFCQRMVAPSAESLVTQYVGASLAGHDIMV